LHAGLAIVVVVTGVSPTKSPECNGMNNAKTGLEKGISQFTTEPVKCLVNDACTGMCPIECYANL